MLKKLHGKEIEFEVKGFNFRGELLLHTVHTTTASKDAEVEAWKNRMKRKNDNAACIEVIDRKNMDKQTIYGY